MTPYRLALLVLLVCVSLTGCGSSREQEQADAMPNQELNGEGCSVPPRFIDWSNKKYELKATKDEAAEPGMKLGYLTCKDGVYTQLGEGENAVFNMYINGNPSLTHELIYLGEWGYAVYTQAS
ncbi:hypothetical protein H8B09_20455 [Paenibacillus sp. PR3]|uniref:Lipoprotein n=1 Tax=Paenibacillus terricola TaxID=2763503 RepID=A0ABR8N0U2_9BACL|nr:hypothetical protein [Paenibacillus terricola]MBD3921151.1 hypothetical protein [Paenibacillus terricola]